MMGQIKMLAWHWQVKIWTTGLTRPAEKNKSCSGITLDMESLFALLHATQVSQVFFSTLASCASFTIITSPPQLIHATHLHPHSSLVTMVITGLAVKNENTFPRSAYRLDKDILEYLRCSHPPESCCLSWSKVCCNMLWTDQHGLM